MTIQIRFVEKPALHPRKVGSIHYDGSIHFDQLQVGDLCYFHDHGVPCMDRSRLEEMHLTAHYFAHNAGRPPLVLAMPDRAYPQGKMYFLVDGQCYSGTCKRCGKGRLKCQCGELQDARGYYDGWTVSGDPPFITVQPSVNFDDDEGGIKHYHGFITNGVIGDG